MKPLRLRLQAFGPYSGTSVIDFRSLAGGGLFLIHGQTGAGKTSLLDGLCFALFGTASGDDRDGEGMRCDLAPLDLPTEVTLEFALGSRIYRVIRRPRQELKKQRGAGTTTKEADGNIYELETASTAAPFDISAIDLDLASWKLLAAGALRTGERVRELIGMDDKQFRQVVVLPQGQFRRFLSAGSTDREKILETLFRTKRFRDITERLSKRSDTIERELKEKRKLLEGQLVSLSAMSEDEINARMEELEARHRDLASSKAAVDERHRNSSTRLELAKTFDRIQRELSANEKSRLELEARLPAIEAAKNALETHRRAQPVLAVAQNKNKCTDELASLEKQSAAETTKHSESIAKLNEIENERSPLLAQEPEIIEAQSEIQILREQLVKAEKLNAAKKSVIELVQKAEASRSAMAALDRTLGEQKERLASLIRALEETNAKATRAETLKSQRELLSREADQHAQACLRAKKVLELTKTLESKAQELREAETETARAKGALTKLKIQYHLSQAAQLASELKNGAPCMVCGSTSHPSPAAFPEEAPKQHDIERSEGEVSRLEGRLAEYRAQYAALEREKTALLEDLMRLYPEAQDPLLAANTEAVRVRDQITQKDLETREAHNAEAKTKELKSQIVSLEQLFEASELKRKSLQSEAEDARAAVEGRKAAVAELESLLTAENREPATIIARGKTLREKIDSFQKRLQDLNRLAEEERARATSSQARIETLAGEIKKRSDEIGRLEAELKLALLKAGFQDLEACRASSLTEDRATRMENDRRSFENEWAVNQSRAAELKSESARLPALVPDLAMAELEFRAADEERTKHLTESAELLARVHDLKLARKKLQEIGGEIRGLEDRYRVLGRLAKVASGQPPHNLTGVNFQRFVLASQLDDVLEQASRRLLVMSRGQFHLRRVRGRDDKRMSAGLDLEVEDSFTGTARSTATLSGGEGFLASLALALGLADVVQSHLGGVRLDAVFIDEGFGTLDPEALELAMKTLAELQAGGRIVGIISHVPELKEQISHRLFVRKTPSGSEIAWL